MWSIKCNKKQINCRQIVFACKYINWYINNRRSSNLLSYRQKEINNMNIISRACYVILTDCTARYASHFITFCNSEERLRKRNNIDNSDIQLVREEREVAPRDKISSSEYYCIAFVYSARATVFYAVTLSLAKRNYPDSIIFRGAETCRAAHRHWRALYFYAYARHFARPLLTIGDQSDRTISQFRLPGSQSGSQPESNCLAAAPYPSRPPAGRSVGRPTGRSA